MVKNKKVGIVLAAVLILLITFTVAGKSKSADSIAASTPERPAVSQAA